MAPTDVITARLPPRYGTVGVKQPNGSYRDYPGGAVVEISAKQAAAIGAEPVEGKAGRAPRGPSRPETTGDDASKTSA